MTDLIRRNMMEAANKVPIDAIIVAKRSDNEAALMEIAYAQEWSASPRYMTKSEAEAVTHIPYNTFTGNTKITDLSVLQYFTNLKILATSTISQMPNLVSIKLPLSIEKVNIYAFDNLPLLIYQGLNLPNCTYVSMYGFGRNNMGGFANGARIYAPNLVGAVDFYPFSRSTGNVRYIYLGDRVTELDYPLIPNLYNDLTVVCMAQIPPSIKSYNTCPGKVLYVPRVSLDAYMADELWSSAYKNIYAIEDIDPNLLAYMKFETDILPTE